MPDKSDHPEASDRNHAAYKLGVQHFKVTDYRRAAQAFFESLEYWPEDPQAWFALGNCYDELEQPGEAERCFRESLEHSPAEKRPDIYYNLANALFDLNRFSEAIELYEMIPSVHPIYEKARKNLKLARKRATEQDTAPNP